MVVVLIMLLAYKSEFSIIITHYTNKISFICNYCIDRNYHQIKITIFVYNYNEIYTNN